MPILLVPFIPLIPLSSPTQLPEAQELHRLAYIDFAHALLAAQLEDQQRLLSFAQARQLAEQCGFVGDEEVALALRVMEQVFYPPSLVPFSLTQSSLFCVQWMISCKLTSSMPSMVVLDVEWLSLLLFQLLHPHRSVALEAGGILSQRRLFDRWLRKELLENRDLCQAFLLCLSELHVWREERSERFPEEEEGVIMVPHAMSVLVPPCMAEAVRKCISHPHGGWRAKPLQGEQSGEKYFLVFLQWICPTRSSTIFLRSRRVVDPIVFSQLLLHLKSACDLPVLIPCRRVGLVHVDAERPCWFLLCWTHSSITIAAADCSVFSCICGAPSASAR